MGSHYIDAYRMEDFFSGTNRPNLTKMGEIYKQKTAGDTSLEHGRDSCILLVYCTAASQVSAMSCAPAKVVCTPSFVQYSG